MTGYGRAEGSTQAGDLVIEIRTVNHRSLDLHLRGPREMGAVEPRLRDAIRRRVSRGRVEVYTTVRHRSPERVQLKIDADLARKYRDAALSLAEDLDLPTEITVDFIMRLPEVFYEREEALDADRFWKEFSPLLQAALDQVVSMRREEGARLVKDVRSRLKKLETAARAVGRRRKTAVKNYHDLLHERLNELVKDLDLDPIRMAQEAALLAEKSDINEELVRVESHLKQFRAELSSAGSIGRQLDFLCQEFIREVNTMGSKSTDMEITRRVLAMKGEIEKIREQAQNIE